MQDYSYDREAIWDVTPARQELAVYDPSVRVGATSGWRNTAAIAFAISPGVVFLANVLIYALIRN